MKKRIPILLAFLLGVASPYLAEFGCGQIGHLYFADGYKEVFRTTSPDGVLDAVVMQNNPGAFNSFQYYLFFVPKGAQVKAVPDDPAIVSTSEGDQLKVQWKSPHFIAVEPGNSHVKFFSNYWYSKHFKNYGVELDYVQSSDRHYLKSDGSFHNSN